MEITKKAFDKILEGFSERSTESKITLGLTSPLWFTGLVVSGTVEGVIDVAKEIAIATGKLAGSAGNATLVKIQRLETLQASLNPKGLEIRAEFEGNVYKFDQSIALLKTLSESDPRASVLYKAIETAIIAVKGA